MSAVAGLAIAAGYHDSHVGVTKLVVRRFRVWRRRHGGIRHEERGIGEGEEGRRSRPVSVQSGPMPSIVTVERIKQHHRGALRAAEVSARVSSLIP